MRVVVVATIVAIVLIAGGLFYLMTAIDSLGSRLSIASDQIVAIQARMQNFSIESTSRHLCMSYIDDNGSVITLSCNHADQGWTMGIPNQ